MPSDTVTLETRSAPNDGSHAKYRLLTRDHLDGRTAAAKQFGAVARAIAEDLGGEAHLSAIQKHLVEAFAGVSIHLGDIHARLLLGEKIDITEHATAVSTMVRIAQRVGVHRVPRDVEPLDQYLARKKLAISLSQALNDPELFGKTFAAPSFWTWRTVAKVIDGLPLNEHEVQLFRECTGRTRLPAGPVRRIINLTGRRGGKDRFLSSVAVWRAALCCNWHQHISAGEQAVVLLLGADRKQAGILRRYCSGLLEAKRLRREIVRRDRDIIEFRNGSALEIGTNDARLIRGRSAIAVLGSEASHWKTDEASASSDEEVVGAATPSMAMCPDGGLLMLGSSVYRKRGYMYRRYRELHGNDDAEDIVWFAPSQVMNPSLPASAVDKAMAEDAPKARAEFLNIWREDLSDFIPIDVIDAATDWGVSERPPLLNSGIKYIAWADAAGGTGKDSFTLAVAHREKDRTAVLDLVRERKPRFVASAVVAEFAAMLRQYRITEVWGDAFAGGFHADAWANQHIKFKPAERNTSENYLALLPLLTQPGRVHLLHDQALRHQLAGLERRTHAGDRESVSHANTQSAHDDVAAAAAGALVLAASRPPYNFWWPLGLDENGEPPQNEQPTTQPRPMGIPVITAP